MTPLSRPRPADPERILLLKFGALGDLLFADGALMDLRQAFPRTHITLLTRKPYAAWYARHPALDEVEIDPSAARWRIGAMLSLRQRLRSLRPDWVVDLQNNRRSRFYRRWLLDGLADNALDAAARWHPVGPLPSSVCAQHALQLAALGLAPDASARPCPRWLVAPSLSLPMALPPDPIVLLPGASARHPGKRWPHYRELAGQLIARGWPVVQVPGPDEQGLPDLPGLTLRHGQGRVLGLDELAWVLGKARAVIGNDSGPTHLAALLDRPGLALFGGPGALVQAARTGMGTRAMRGLCAPRLEAIRVEEVLVALDGVLRGGAQPRST